MKWILLKIIRGYQLFLSPVLGSSCRFDPTCSHYTKEAIEVHGPIKGSWMGVKRIGKCHPWGKGGYDPVPNSNEKEKKTPPHF